jgi:DNA-binding response OmpR family regulator
MSPYKKFMVVPVIEAAMFGRSSSAVRPPVVLVVDDERIIADTLTAILKRSGYSVLTAYDGQSALGLASEIPPDLLITDVVMPGMSGIDLAIQLERAIPDCMVLLFSGQAATVDLLADARKLGHDFVTLSKPVHPTELLARISECLESRPPATVVPSRSAMPNAS